MTFRKNRSAVDKIFVLVADDDAIFRELATSQLANLDVQVVEAKDGAAAWQCLLNQSFDLAIVDLSMPQLDGFQLIECMRAHPRTKYMPILVVTSMGCADAIERALSVGASSFLMKPLNWRAFEHHVGHLLRLADANRRSRNIEHETTIVAKYCKVILSNLCTEIISGSTRIRHDMDRAKLVLPSNEVQTAGLAYLHSASEQATANETLALKAARVLKHFSEEIFSSNQRVDLAAILQAAVATVDAHAEGSARMLLVEQSADAILICDQVAIETALTCLIRSALQHSPPDGTVTIKAHIFEDGLLSISVADQGIGMHPDDISSYLDPLYGILDNGDAADCLPLAKTIAEIHGGALEIRSMSQRGTTVRFILPPERVLIRTPVKPEVHYERY